MSLEPTLEAVQAAFLHALETGETPPAWLLQSATTEPAVQQRFRVYVNQAHIARLEALQGIYPAIRRLVGEDFFDHMAALYIEQHALQRADLQRYGAQLPDFIAAFEPLAGLPYLPDVARLEWACHEAMHAGRGAPATARADLRLAPHVRLLRSPFPSADIWEFALGDRTGGRRLDIEGAPPAYVLVARPGLEVEVRCLDASDWRWLAECGRRPARRAASGRHAYWAERGILSAHPTSDETDGDLPPEQSI